MPPLCRSFTDDGLPSCSDPSSPNTSPPEMIQWYYHIICIPELGWVEAGMADGLCKEVEEEVMDTSRATISRAANRVLISSLVQYLKLGGIFQISNRKQHKQKKQTYAANKLSKQLQQTVSTSVDVLVRSYQTNTQFASTVLIKINTFLIMMGTHGTWNALALSCM